MPNELLALAAILWAAGGMLALTGRGLVVVRAALGLGALAGIAAAIVALPGGTAPVTLPLAMAGEHFGFRIAPDGLWLMGFGLAPAAWATWLAAPMPAGRAGWLFGAALSLLGALGVFGMQNAGGFLIAWEVMSLGGAVMILGERMALAPGTPVLFMLGLLEVGAVALLIAFLALVTASGSLSFAGFAAAGIALPGWVRDRGRRAAGDRLRRQARPAAVLRVVPRRLRRRQRRVRGDPVRRGAERRVLRASAAAC